MRITLITLLLTIASLTIAAPDTATPGKVLFDKKCAECHAPGFGHPGTQRLEWSRGARYSVLEQRKDLTPGYIKTVVRHGLAEMPPFRPSELPDSELQQIANYLALH
jgi:mono/diheme cytochrome c family protein